MPSTSPTHSEPYPVEYVAFLHELISSYHEKLSEVLSPIVAETFRITLVDKLMTTLSPMRNLDEPQVFDKVSHLLADGGIKMHIDEKGE